MAIGTEMTIFERALIQIYLERGYSIPKIAKLLGRSSPTLYREIRRCILENPNAEEYDFEFAQILHDENVLRRKRGTVLSNSPTATKLIEHLVSDEGLSPEIAVDVVKQVGLSETIPHSSTVRGYYKNGLMGSSDKALLSQKNNKNINSDENGSCSDKCPNKTYGVFFENREFSIIRSSLIRDTSISPGARLLMILILDLPRDSEIKLDRLHKLINGDGNKYRGYGKCSMYSLMQELTDAGYILKEQIRGNDGQFKTVRYSLNPNKN